MPFKQIIASILLLFTGNIILAQQLEYHLSMPEPHTHYFEVEMRVSGLLNDSFDLKMATWTPGSYLIREFSRNVETLEAFAGNEKVTVTKILKNTWRIYAGGDEQVRVRYRVYAYEHTVRTSYLDESHAYINGPSVFMYIQGYEQLSSTLHITPFPGWRNISTGLDPVSAANPWLLQVPDWTTLADSPIEIGNHHIISFNAVNIPHHVAMYGEANYNQEQIITDFRKIIEECTKVFGENPVPHYTFIVHNIESGRGGLEHMNSTTLIWPRWNYRPRSNYNAFLTLVAHEYFHLWNVKRLRPAGIWPYDYENENYTRQLWVSEGFTSYYDDHILRRANIISPEEYMGIVSRNITTIENTPGNFVQPLSESSFDTWIKFYRPNENSRNVTISYYTRGAVIATLLDLMIINHSNGTQSLDNVMRHLYQDIYKRQKRGFTEEDMKQALERFTGSNLDTFYSHYIHGTEPIDYNHYFSLAGLSLVDLNEGRGGTHLGVNTEMKEGRLTVTGVTRGTAAYTHGINVNDEIIAIDGYRLRDNLSQLIGRNNPGDEVEILINRDGQIRSLLVELGENPGHSYSFISEAEPTDQQLLVRSRWLRQ